MKRLFLHALNVEVLGYILTWRGGIDTAEEKLSSVQNRGGHGMMAHFPLQPLIIIQLGKCMK